MTDETAPHLVLGLGEEVTVRKPTRPEQRRLGLTAGDLVLEYRHTDREPDVLPARGVTISPRRYGVTLPDRAGDES